MADRKKKQSEPEIPEYLREFVTRGSVAMEDISRYMERQNIAWPQLVDTLNSDFLLHNVRTEALCKSIDASVTQSQTFQKDVWNKTWKLVERILIVAVTVISAIAGFRIFTGGVP